MGGVPVKLEQGSFYYICNYATWKMFEIVNHTFYRQIMLLTVMYIYTI